MMLIQKQGYNGFSYCDLSKLLGITTASIHYHYKKKEDLGVAAVKYYHIKIIDLLYGLAKKRGVNVKSKLLLLVEEIANLTIYDSNKICLAGILASELPSLPSKIQQRVNMFFTSFLDAIIMILEMGLRNGSYKIMHYTLEQYAQALLIQIEGALLLARIRQDVKYIDMIKIFINSTIRGVV